MARRFFMEKVPRNNNSLLHVIIVIACVIGVIICFVVISHLLNNSHKNAVYELRDVTVVPLNSKLDDKTIFFKELQHVKEKDIIVDDSKVDYSQIGTYDVKISLYKSSYDVLLEVADFESPELAVKDINVEKGYDYQASDFVSKCTDNSNKECLYKFYELTTDQDGNPVDYSTYKEDGEYTVLIVAYDETGNETAPAKATLVIGTPSETGEILCKYGKNDYDTEKYVLATYITQNDCALDLNLYNDEKTQIPATQIMENETEKLKKEFESLHINSPVTLNRIAQAVINNDGTGIVGYTVHMELIIDDKVVESYYVNLEGHRVYSVNEYNLN